MLQPGKLRVILADDHTLFRKGLVSLLSDRDDMEVVGDVGNGQAAIEMARAASPDLILMDVHMPGCDGITAVKEIKKEMPGIKVVMLSAFDDDEDLFAAIKNGADGYLLKNLLPSQFFGLLEGVVRGEAAISGVLADRILRAFRKADQGPRPGGEVPPALTPREIETLELLVQGKSNKEIAAALAISENTVKRHLVDIMDKLHLENRIQLAVYAVHQGLDDGVPRDCG
jgi:two-component system nitrate/nitrite response regulator NarL